ncbi:hypothetical protein HHI36_015555 [Cryptolaemus montrouzieri]|uniref:Sodefrin-like factor n=1 Tax=Cryptolaemus montrouzieri TaxID=559131 RepID=A0ABD2N5X3_9CUCU
MILEYNMVAVFVGLISLINSAYGLKCYKCHQEDANCAKMSSSLPTVECEPSENRCAVFTYEFVVGSKVVGNKYDRDCAGPNEYCDEKPKDSDSKAGNDTGVRIERYCDFCEKDLCNAPSKGTENGIKGFLFLFVFLILFCLIRATFTYNLKLHDGDENNCAKPGLMCEECRTAAVCIEIDGVLTRTGRLNCPHGYSCYNGVCTKDVNPLCDYKDLNFPCQYKGNYPHPGDWTKYVVCVPTYGGTSYRADTVDCESGTGYNALTTYCSENLTNIDPATFPIDRCMEPSQNPVALKQNPSIYYVCAPYGSENKLYPYQFTCPYGGTYDSGVCTPHLTGIGTSIEEKEIDA